MHHPFQCLSTVNRGESSYLLAACGSQLISTCISSGQVVSDWSAVDSPEAKDENAERDNHSERPAKKQKTNTKPSPPIKINIIKLATTPDHTHAVAVTDDKCLRVFSISPTGTLTELSQRFMPKRPCAIQVLPDNATILCGDKFGDVYSLPLHHEEQPPPSDPTTTTNPTPAPQQQQPFKPSATPLTVHTQRNRKALESQLRQKNLTPKTKEPLKFAHRLLLGHVSMLTDLTYAEGTPPGAVRPRGHILTADRDEHIRVSRGPPQTHVIEGYCLGHAQFVSKLCAVAGTELLVSGGGDKWVGVWHWPSFSLRRRVEVGAGAVAGIWEVSAVGDGGERVVAVAMERAGRLGLFSLGVGEEPAREGSVEFEHAVMDVCVVGAGFVVSLDAREEGQRRLRAYQVRMEAGRDELTAAVDEALDATLAKMEHLGEISSGAGLEDLLYGVENLRKREYDDGNAEE